MSALVLFRRRSTLVPTLVAGSVAGLLAGEQVLPRLEKPVPPTVEFYPYTGPGRSREAFICVTGLRSDPSESYPLLGYLRSQGDVLIISSGSDVNVTPLEMVRSIWKHRLHRKAITVIGQSLGTNLAVRFLRIVQGTSRATNLLVRLLGFIVGRCGQAAALKRIAGNFHVQAAVMISGPADQHSPLWHNQFERHASMFLGGGPISQAIWWAVKRHDVADARTMVRLAKTPEELATAKQHLSYMLRLQNLRARHLTTGFGALREGPGLKYREFATPTLNIERVGDDRVKRNPEGWGYGFINLEYYLITTCPGHINMADCPEEYIEAMHSWRVRNHLILEPEGV